MGLEVNRPQKPYFDKAQDASKAETALAIAAGVFAILATILDGVLLSTWWGTFAMTITILLSLGVCIARGVYACALHEAETERRRGFTDNAFDVKLSKTKSERYYDTDDMVFGVKKALANVHQSCLSTIRISELMLKRVIPGIVITAVVLIVCAVIGFQRIIIVAPVFNVLVSVLMLRSAFDTILLHREMVNIEVAIRSLWQAYSVQDDDSTFVANAFFLVIRYECAITRASTILDGKIYSDTRLELLREWEQIRTRYNI